MHVFLVKKKPNKNTTLLEVDFFFFSCSWDEILLSSGKNTSYLFIYF